VNDIEFLSKYDGPALRIMEVCGTHTSAIFKSGIRSFLSPKIKLVSGPGCPVCVTVPSYIDECIKLSLLPDHEIVCFGDLLKIPGTEQTLSDAKSIGGHVRMVWSPFETIELAKQNPEKTFIVTAIGFETTAPAFALLIEECEEQGIENIKLLTSLKSAMSAIDWICAAGEDIDAFLCPGHVSVITGADAFRPLAEKYKKPFIVAGFEGEHLISAIRTAAEDATNGNVGVRNLYPEAVNALGNQNAKDIIERYYDLGDADWRGLGMVPKSGYFLKPEKAFYDEPTTDVSSPSLLPDGCRCGDVILGRIDPNECPLFGKVCSPSDAVGPCMVSSEGACGIWYSGA
jgi:hydrogenase expression/formation protein HypD